MFLPNMLSSTLMTTWLASSNHADGRWPNFSFPNAETGRCMAALTPVPRMRANRVEESRYARERRVAELSLIIACILTFNFRDAHDCSIISPRSCPIIPSHPLKPFPIGRRAPEQADVCLQQGQCKNRFQGYKRRTREGMTKPIQCPVGFLDR